MNYIILISFILLISGTIGESTIKLTAKNISFAGGCIWTNSSFTILAKAENTTNEDDLYFNLNILDDNVIKSAYCRIPSITSDDDTKMYCSCKEVSNREIVLQDTQGSDVSGNYTIYFIGQSLAGKTLKCEESYLIQNLVLLIALIGLLI